jgi:hypothetical protein
MRSTSRTCSNPVQLRVQSQLHSTHAAWAFVGALIIGVVTSLHWHRFVDGLVHFESTTRSHSLTSLVTLGAFLALLGLGAFFTRKSLER